MHSIVRSSSLLIALLALVVVAAACGEEDSTGGSNNVGNNGNNGNNGADDGLLSSSKQRITAPDADPTELATLTLDNRAFALDLYQLKRSDPGNLFYSPHSISIALAMTWGGARGETADQMAETMHYTLGAERLHTSFNALDLALSSRGEDVQLDEGEEGDPFRLSIVNAIWGQRDYTFLESYLDLLALNYGAGLRPLDFAADPDGSRQTINTWVEDQTEDRIKDLLPEGSIDGNTRLVLTNAVYFKASWLNAFEVSLTRDGEFTRPDGTTTTAPFMHQQESLAYGSGEGWAAVELPYVGRELSMVVILPDAGSFDTFEAGLDVETLDGIIDGLSETQVAVALPKFTFEYDLPLNQPLMDLGMTAAFGGDADFSGINGVGGLQITDVLHKAFVAVDEKGTEAAAATAVVVGETSVGPDPVVFSADRPFIFLVRDLETGAIIFLGRVVDPG